MKKSVVEKELSRLEKKRAAYIQSYTQKRELAPELAAKIPPQLRSTLNTAFTKAFELIFEKGTGLIDKTYNKENTRTQYEINRYAAELRRNSKSLRAFQKQTSGSGALSLLVSGAEGIGLGLLGCGLPDIPILTAAILRSLYELATSYGYDYTRPEERRYILLLIEGAMSYGDKLADCQRRLDALAHENNQIDLDSLAAGVNSAASALADEMLFLKFVQGIPIVGVIGGISNPIFLKRIRRFALLNYQYRLLVNIGWQ